MKDDKKRAGKFRLQSFVSLAFVSHVRPWEFVQYGVRMICLLWVVSRMLQTQHTAVRWRLDTTAIGYLPAIGLSWEKYTNEPFCEHHAMAHTLYSHQSMAGTVPLSSTQTMGGMQQPAAVSHPACRSAPLLEK